MWFDSWTASSKLTSVESRHTESSGSPLTYEPSPPGVVNPRPEVKVLRKFGATELLDGDNGLGVVIGQLAMDRAVEIASELGVGVIAVRNSNHTGMLAVHVLKAASRDMIGYFTSNGPAIMAPFGGREARMGNSPFAYAIPTHSGEPIVLDLACSVVARGKIRMYADHGEPIPEGWALDAEGFPTRDAEAAMDGAVLPMAGYKGYGIAFVTEVIGAVLPGGETVHRNATSVSPGRARRCSTRGEPVISLWRSISRVSGIRRVSRKK